MIPGEHVGGEGVEKVKAKWDVLVELNFLISLALSRNLFSLNLFSYRNDCVHFCTVKNFCAAACTRPSYEVQFCT